MENFNQTLDFLATLNKEYSIFVPSLNRQLKFKGLTTKQQKDIVKSVLDRNAAGITFANLLCDIITESSVEQNINFLLVDRFYIIAVLRSISLSPILKVKDETIDLSFINQVNIPVPQVLRTKIVEDGPLVVHLAIPNFKKEILINNESKKVTQNAEDKDEITKEIIGELYIHELVKYIDKVMFKNGETPVDIDFNDINITQKKQIVEKLPLTTNTAIISYINEVKQFESKYFIKDYKIKNEIIIRKRKYQFKNLVFQMHTIKISLRSQIIRFKTKINEQRRSL